MFCILIAGTDHTEVSPNCKHSAERRNTENRLSSQDGHPDNLLEHCAKELSHLCMGDRLSVSVENSASEHKSTSRDQSSGNVKHSGTNPSGSKRRSTSPSGSKRSGASPSGNKPSGASPVGSKRGDTSPSVNKHREGSPSDSTQNQHNEVTGIPPKVQKAGKSKKDQRYIPNTFVPNRTLMLRRAGSLNSLSDRPDLSSSDAESVTSQSSRETIPNVARKSMTHSRSISRSGHS